MKTIEITVATSADDVGLVATMWALSPKRRGGWHQFFWTGVDPAHPGAAMWSPDAGRAERFESVEALEGALAALDAPWTVAAFQLPLW